MKLSYKIAFKIWNNAFHIIFILRGKKKTAKVKNNNNLKDLGKF